MTISLISNVSRLINSSVKESWMGTDPNTIRYPGLSICISVTCVMKKKEKNFLAGAHLMSHCTPRIIVPDIQTFAQTAMNPQSVYVVGFMQNWLADDKKNTCGLVYDPDKGGGTLLKTLWEELGYSGSIIVYDLAQIGGMHDIDLTADRFGGAVQFYYGDKEPIDVDRDGKAFSGKEIAIIMKHQVKQGGRCTIL